MKGYLEIIIIEVAQIYSSKMKNKKKNKGKKEFIT